MADITYPWLISSEAVLVNHVLHIGMKTLLLWLITSNINII